MQDGHHDFKSRFLMYGMRVDGNPSPVVQDCYTPVRVNCYIYPGTEACKGFINAIVYYFLDQVVKSTAIRAPYIHAGTFPDSIQAFKHLDARSIVNLFITHLGLFSVKIQ